LQLVLGFPLPIILALSLNEVQNMKFRKFVQTVSYAPHFIATVVLCGMVTMFMSPSSGVIGMGINAFRELIGLNPVNYMTRGAAFKWIYVLSGIWQGTGWGSVLYFAALSGVDPQLAEAAKVDGANKVQCIWHINIPVLIPTMVINLIMKCGSLMSVGHEKVYLLQNDTILRSSEVISTYVYRVGLQGGQYSFSTAVGLFNSIINATLLILVNKITGKLDDSLSLW
jgi:putative aldouronate transport system permease protein